MTRTDLLHQLSVLLAGRTAEEIALGEISTGAQNDLQRASDIARAMVTEFGMSDSVGAINYAAQKRSRFLDVGMPNDSGPYAEETAQLIDREVKRHGRRVTRGGPPHPQRAPGDARSGYPPAAGEGSDGWRRAPRDHGGDSGRGGGDGAVTATGPRRTARIYFVLPPALPGVSSAPEHLTQRKRGLLPDVGVGILHHRGCERVDSAGVPDLAERERGLLAHVGLCV